MNKGARDGRGKITTYRVYGDLPAHANDLPHSSTVGQVELDVARQKVGHGEWRVEGEGVGRVGGVEGGRRGT